MRAHVPRYRRSPDLSAAAKEPDSTALTARYVSVIFNGDSGIGLISGHFGEEDKNDVYFI